MKPETPTRSSSTGNLSSRHRIVVRLLAPVLWLLPLVSLPSALSGCAPVIISDDGNDNGAPSDALDDVETPPAAGGWYRPPVATTWQWQLQPNPGGQINTSYDVDVYDIDLFDSAPELIADLQADGRKVICYFSAGSFEDFREDAGAFLPADLGEVLEGFADERWLDIRSDNVRGIMLRRMDMAVQKGCDGVEPDNMTGFANNTGFDLGPEDQLAYNRFIADAAHERGLSVGLKNDLDQVAELVDSFDFSVNEQCHEFDECDLLTPFINAGKPVFNAEYDERFVADDAPRAEMCADALELGLRTLVLSIDLDDSLRFSCDQ